MDPTFFQVWLPIALGCINLGGWIWATLQSPAKKNADAISGLATAIADNKRATDESVAALSRRTSALEDTMKHLPDKESIHRLELSLKDLGGDVRVINETMKALRDISVTTREFIFNKDTA